MTVTAPFRRMMCLLAGSAALLCFAVGCNRSDTAPNTFQGYVEGEYVSVAAPLPGRLATLFVQRGAQVKAGDPLFELESVQEKAARDEAKLRLDQLRSQVNDARKGKRPTEIEATTAQLNLARTALQLSEKELLRQEKLLAANVVPLQEVDRLRSRREQDRQRVTQLEAELATAKLGLRSDQVAATEAGMRALEAALGRSEWELTQKRQSAPAAGVVFDTLYRAGEWVAAGKPVAVLLPPQNIKVRTFVPQSFLAAIRLNDTAQVSIDGAPAPVTGRVAFISPQAEYTPPVIYSRESRQKLVYLVEVAFDAATAVRLHPGQPVTVRLGSGS